MHVEKRSIDFIPENERHGKPGSLFYIWFGANMNITTIASGVLPVVIGLNLFWSALAIILGSLIGAIFMASHSAQGPKLGIPQMIQSRAQFGVIGAVLPLLFVMLIYLGFFVSNTLLAAQAIESVSPLGGDANIYLIGTLCFVVALYGYRLIHRLQKGTVTTLGPGVPGRDRPGAGPANSRDSMVARGILVVEVHGGGQHCGHLAAVLCALCRRLFPLSTERHADVSGVLVQLWWNSGRRGLDDDPRRNAVRGRRRLLRQRRQPSRNAVCGFR